MAENSKGLPVPSLLVLRKRAGLSQEELAERAGIGKITISRLERGANARYDTIDKLAEALGTTRTRLIRRPRQRNASLKINQPSREVG